jgi:spermidine synthase
MYYRVLASADVILIDVIASLDELKAGMLLCNQEVEKNYKLYTPEGVFVAALRDPIEPTVAYAVKLATNRTGIK